MAMPRLGRLFWKFFLFFWLAQLLTSLGVGVAMWWLHPHRGEHHAPPPLVAGQATALPPAPGLPLPPPPPPEKRPEGKNMLLSPPVMPLLAGSIVSLFFAFALAWYFARPIRVLRGAFDDVAGGRLAVRVSGAMAGRKDELADLGSDFDRMAERLQGLVEGQQRLLHDVSHELRSPLARLQAVADLMTQQPERAGEFIARIERETSRMDHLVGELLTLARLDAGIAGDLDAVVEVTEVLADIADDAGFEAQARNCRVVLGGDEGLVTCGNRELLHRALENIVRNALRYSPEGGDVSISASRDAAGQMIFVVVDDSGPGVPEADLATIFEPFQRSAGADAFAGYGLGLAIASRVLRAHGGTIHAENRPTGGLRVSVQLPAMPSRSD